MFSVIALEGIIIDRSRQGLPSMRASERAGTAIDAAATPLHPNRSRSH